MYLKNLSFLTLTASLLSAAPSTLEPAQGYAWSENTGYINAGDAEYGLVVKQSHLLGHAWSPAIGWIRFGHGPENTTSYAQTGDDIGVNRSVHDGALNGYAWAENVGWIRFDGRAAMDETGHFSGHAWGENIGWIALGAMRRAPDNEWDGLKDSIDPDDDNDLLPDVEDPMPFDPANGLADTDGDGENNGREYVAGTDANDASSVFRVRGVEPNTEGFHIVWDSVPGKTYRILKTVNLADGFQPIGADIIADSAETEVIDPNASDAAFYSVEVLP